MLNQEDLVYQEKEPTEAELAAEEEQISLDQANAKVVQELCISFFNEKLAKLDIPMYLVEEVTRSSMNVLFSVHKSKSKQNAAFLQAKALLEETSIKDLC